MWFKCPDCGKMHAIPRVYRMEGVNVAVGVNYEIGSAQYKNWYI